ncbi:MAG: helix-turn-helix domain-containing protein [Nitrosopumilus sp.]|nr:helix-turn-helix domain-containing protein [Nitrosopumilus sp.]
MIFSVMASPNRIDILRILNSKGPLTYSELKSLAGFRSKKESGKFAYHLRKLLRQSLVGLNKAERRYAITNLGKLVLNLARQIEEKSIIESGKMYVRTSNQTIEEFNAHKIIQCLVREANMSMEQSTKVTEEVENKIYKSPASYLTSSLIRDCVNSVLFEHGFEEQMNKLIRVGIPIYDLNKKLNNNSGLLNNGINDVIIDISKSVFSDYLKNNFPKDILDMHYNGELHLEDLGNWGIRPDTLFIDTGNFLEKDMQLNGQFPYLPRYSNLDNAVIVLPFLVSLFHNEVSKEIVVENIAKLFNSFSSKDEISSTFANSLLYSSFSLHSLNLPFITIVLTLKDDGDVLLSILNGYLIYLKKVPISKFGIFIHFSNPPSKDILNMIAKITKFGGKISLSQKSIRSSKGIFKLNDGTNLPVLSLHSISLNLPHLAYQSNKDETYFRTKLALLLKPSLNAMVLKKEIIFDNIRKGLLPALSNPLMFPQSGSTNMLINLTGLNESIFNILGYSNNSEEGIEIVKKVIKTSNDVISHYDKKNYEHFGISIINDNSSSRFVQLDSEKFGKISHTFDSYSQGLVITKKDLDEENFLVRNLLVLEDLLTGGFAVKLDTTSLSLTNTVEFLSKSIDLIPYFEIADKQIICNICGSRVSNSDICSICKSNNLLTLT